MKQRTTLTADADDLETLRSEARRLGISLNAVLQGVVSQKAEEIQRAKRPRVGLYRSGDAGSARRSVTEEGFPADTPYRS